MKKYRIALGKIIERNGFWYYQPWPGELIKLNAKTKNEAIDEAMKRQQKPKSEVRKGALK